MASPTAAPAKYTEQLVIMVTPEVKRRVVEDATNHELSKSEVARTYIELGIETADARAAEVTA